MLKISSTQESELPLSQLSEVDMDKIKVKILKAELHISSTTQILRTKFM
jgi:hypothetical protein